MFNMNIKMEQTELNSIDFSNINFSDDAFGSLIILKIRNIKNGAIVHSQEKINRCCKDANPKKNFYKVLSTNWKDNIPRISCDTSKQLFWDEYVTKRSPVILRGCQENWPARYWTYRGTVKKKISS